MPAYVLALFAPVFLAAAIYSLRRLLRLVDAIRVRDAAVFRAHGFQPSDPGWVRLLKLWPLLRHPDTNTADLSPQARAELRLHGMAWIVLGIYAFGIGVRLVDACQAWLTG